MGGVTRASGHPLGATRRCLVGMSAYAGLSMSRDIAADQRVSYPETPGRSLIRPGVLVVVGVAWAGGVAWPRWTPIPCGRDAAIARRVLAADVSAGRCGSTWRRSVEVDDCVAIGFKKYDST